MKVWKLVSSIISIVFSMFIIAQIVFLGACKYIYLNIWAIWCFACGVVTFIRFVKDADPDCKNKRSSEDQETANDATKLVKEPEEDLGKEQKQDPAEEKKPDKKPRKKTKKKTEKALPEPPDEVQSEEKTE